MRALHRLVRSLVVVVAAACAGSGEPDPDDLGARDLLGFDPKVAARWDDGERASARRVLQEALRETPGDERQIPLGIGSRRVLGSLSALDHELAEAGAPPWLVARVERVADDTVADIAGVPFDVPLDRRELADTDGVTWRGWDDELDGLAARGDTLIAEFARAVGHGDGHLYVDPAPRTAFAAAYIANDGILLVNPVLLAALDPATPEQLARRAEDGRPPAPRPLPERTLGSVNPYNFYGSVGECAAAERLRCEGCLPSSCEATLRGSTDGNAECMTLLANDAIGTFKLCVNLSLSIATVAECVRETASACSFVAGAGDQIGQLEANASFLADEICLTALDSCLARFYGEPDNQFPLPDGGPAPPPPPPRDVSYDCGDCEDCDEDQSCNCQASCVSCTNEGNTGPTCGGPNCEGGNCSATTCDTGCGGGGEGTGGGDQGEGCDSCGDDSGETSSNDGCGNCNSDDGSSSESCGDSDGDSGDCDTCKTGDSSSSGDQCGGSCGSSDGSTSSCGNCGTSQSGMMGSQGSCGNCSAAPPFARRADRLVVTLVWALLPIALLLRWRRRGGGGK